MSAVWALDLPPTQTLVLLALADDADDHGMCAPSVARIASKTGVSLRQVQRLLKTLRSAGLVVLLRPLDGGRGHTAVYQLQPHTGVTVGEKHERKNHVCGMGARSAAKPEARAASTSRSR
jgi:predicted DNA-binding transcriptional regulator YafY